MKNLGPQLTSYSPTHLADEFRSLCLQYVAHVAQHGVEVVPFVDSTLPLFCAHSPHMQRTMIRAITADIEIFQSIQREGFSLRDTSHHLWRYIRSIGATPDSDLFDKIGPTDLVEMYALDGVRYSQMFRNLRVLEFVSFTLEQMFGMDWRYGVRRSLDDEKLMHAYGEGIFNGTISRTVAVPHPPQIIHEIGSVKLHSFSLLTKYVSPVRLNGQIFGLINVGECEIIGSFA